VRAHITTGKEKFDTPKLPEIFSRKAAVFVTIAKNGKRRGCRGSFEPTTGCLKDEIVQTAIASATADVRYRPVRTNELAHLTFTVSIVGPLRLVKEADGYPPRLYGILLKANSGSGVILPGEAKTARWRLAEAKKQAGVKPAEPYELYVFETVTLRNDKQTARHREEPK
jgi:uncharacterized protein (TIGR00296 family)